MAQNQHLAPRQRQRPLVRRCLRRWHAGWRCHAPWWQRALLQPRVRWPRRQRSLCTGSLLHTHRHAASARRHESHQTHRHTATTSQPTASKERTASSSGILSAIVTSVMVRGSIRVHKGRRRCTSMASRISCRRGVRGAATGAVAWPHLLHEHRRLLVVQHEAGRRWLCRRCLAPRLPARRHGSAGRGDGALPMPAAAAAAVSTGGGRRSLRRRALAAARAPSARRPTIAGVGAMCLRQRHDIGGGSSAELTDCDCRSHRSSESNANRAAARHTAHHTPAHSFAYTRGGVGSRNTPPEALTYRRCVTARYRSWAPEHVACEQHREARCGVGVREFLARQRRQCIQETAVRQAALFLALTLCECEVNLRVCDCPEASGSGKPRQPW